MASQHEWPIFTFFERQTSPRSNVDDFTHELFEQNANIYATSAANGLVAIGDSIGRVHLLDAKWHARTFGAYYRCISHLKLTSSQPSVLVTIGEDEQNSNSSLKVWTQLDKPVDEGGRPLCSSTIILTPHGVNGGKSSSSGLLQREVVTCFDVHESLGFLAIGFHSGSVLLIRGDITKDRHRKQQLIHEGPSPVTGIAFTPGISGKGDATLFFATLAGIYCSRVALKEVGVRRIDESLTSKSKVGISDVAVDAASQNNHNCSCITDLSQYGAQFVVGRRKYFRFYMPEGVGASIAFEGEKVLVQWATGGYLISLSLQRSGGSDGGMRCSDSSDMQMLMVYDVKNKFIAYSSEVQVRRFLLCRIECVFCFWTYFACNNLLELACNRQGAHHIFAEWGSLFLVTRVMESRIVDGQTIENSPRTHITELREKEFADKLEVLERKNQYSLAIALARRHNYDEEGLVGIYRKYGDHLYDKHAYDDAVRQYIGTIGNQQIFLEPSYVIRKFLDAQRVSNLTTYLEALHKKNVASEDHTTLLLNCYTKQKAVDKLNDFIAPLNSNNRLAEYSFNTDTAIRVLRQAGYFELALRLAKLRERHAAYMSIQLDDVKNYDDALQYLRTLDFDSCLRIMDESGKMLINHAPSATCELLKNICTDYDMPVQTSRNNEHLNEHHFKIVAEDDYITRSSSPAVASSSGVPIRHEPRRTSSLRFMHLFVDHPDEMLDFIEYLLIYFQQDAAYVPNELRTALLDLYLKKLETLASSPAKSNENRTSLENKIMKLLEETCQQQQQNAAGTKQRTNDAENPSLHEKDDDKYIQHVDMRQRAIVFCQTHKFARGLLYLYEQLGDYEAILQHYVNNAAECNVDDTDFVDAENDAAILKCCRRFGEHNENVWITAMLYFARNYRPERSAALTETLEHIEKRKLRAPMWIVDQLCGAANGEENSDGVSSHRKSSKTLPWPIPIGLVKKLMLRQLRQDEQRIAEADAVIEKYRIDTEQLRRELSEIEAGPLIFQSSLCTWCNMPLDEPSVHFLCKHSFHKSCFDNYKKDDNAAECLKCRTENRVYMERIQKQRETGDILQHRFKNELEAAFRLQQGEQQPVSGNRTQDVAVGEGTDGFTTIAEFFGRGIFAHYPLSSAVLAKQTSSTLNSGRRVS